MALQSVAPASLFTVSRPDGITYFDANGVLQQSAADELVIDHKYNPATGQWEPRGAPVFPGGTNHVAHSQDLTDAAYAQAVVDRTTDGVIPLRAGSVATKLTRNADSNARVYHNAYTLSADAGDRTTLLAILEADPAQIPPWTSLTNFEANGAGGANLTIDWSDYSLSAAYDSYDNGIAYDSGVIGLGTGPNGGPMVLAYIVAEHERLVYLRPAIYPGGSNGDPAVVGNSVIVHHFQHNEGDNVFPLIFSEGTATTRSADVLVVNGSLDLWRTRDEMSVRVEYEAASPEVPFGSNAVWSFRGVSNTNGLAVYVGTDKTQLHVEQANQLRLQINDSGVPWVAGAVRKAAASVKSGDSAFAADGRSVLTSSNKFDNKTLPNNAAPSLLTNKHTAGGNDLAGWVRSFGVTPRRIPNDQLETLVA